MEFGTGDVARSSQEISRLAFHHLWAGRSVIIGPRSLLCWCAGQNEIKSRNSFIISFSLSAFANLMFVDRVSRTAQPRKDLSQCDQTEIKIASYLDCNLYSVEYGNYIFWPFKWETHTLQRHSVYLYSTLVYKWDAKIVMVACRLPPTFCLFGVLDFWTGLHSD